MKKIFISSLIFCGILTNCFCQSSLVEIKKIKDQLLKAKHDTIRGRLTNLLAEGYRFSNIDSSLFYADQTIAFADKNNLPYIKAKMLSLKGATVLESGKLPESLKFQFEALEISEKIKDTSNIAYALNRIGNIYMELADYKKANEYYFRSKNLFEKIGDIGMFHNEVSNIGNIYDLMLIPDSGLYYHQIVYDAAKKTNDRTNYTRPEMMFRMGNAYNLKGNKDRAMYFYKQGIKEANIDNDIRNLTMNNLYIAKLYEELNMPDSSMKYSYNTIQTGRAISFRKGVYDAAVLLSGLYKNKNQYDSAYKYLAIANIEKDSLIGAKRFQELQRIVLDEQERQRKVETERIADQNKQKQIALIAGLALFLIFGSFLYRNNKLKQKANKVLETTLTNLKSTQAQLIQSEKLASLGELTTGIAHEIQNPLNFVNNFSELSVDLAKDLYEEIDREIIDKEYVKELMGDLSQNQSKINLHGKRASSIVSGMLEHSRTSTGERALTDINKLADEYLRLSYHGIRAKDSSFNSDFELIADENLPKIAVIPQDMGRVLLNLINNAFWAVNDRSKKGETGFEPKVTVTTQLTANSQLLIAIKDNGTGMSDDIKSKIFQPFFTTKPTGQGTGLGLSLAYDIITKGHGGTIEVESVEGEGTTFIVKLPIV